MKRILFFLLLAFCTVPAVAGKTVSIREIFLSLPDSVFTRAGRCFHENDSFPAAERKRLLCRYDSSLNSFTSDSGIRFWISEYSDSLQRLCFTSGEASVTLSVIRENGKGVFFCVLSRECDFVMCDDRWGFFTLRKGKLVEVSHVLPESFSAELFFDTAYLVQMKFDPGMPLDGIEINFTDNPSVFSVTVNYDFFDPELFGEDSPMTKLDPEKMKRTELLLKLKGKKFVME